MDTDATSQDMAQTYEVKFFSNDDAAYQHQSTIQQRRSANVAEGAMLSTASQDASERARHDCAEARLHLLHSREPIP